MLVVGEQVKRDRLITVPNRPDLFREPGQGTTEEHQKIDFAKVLEEKEKGVTVKAIGGEPPV